MYLSIVHKHPRKLKRLIPHVFLAPLSWHCSGVMLASNKEGSIMPMSKTKRIDVRASAVVKNLPQQAASARHKSVSEFLLDDEAWRQFQALFDRPVQEKPALSALLAGEWAGDGVAKAGIPGGGNYESYS